MEKLWVHNKLVDREAMLQQTEIARGGIHQAAIEKDWWVTITLKALFQTACGEALIFKGGTSLSKGFNLTERFSEDVDLAISRSLFDIENSNKSQREKLRKKARAYIHEELSVQLDVQLKKFGLSGCRIENITHWQNKSGDLQPIDSDKDPTIILLHYPSVMGTAISYIPPRVKIEISCLSMDEPTEEREVRSMMSEIFKDDDQEAVCRIKTVLPTRTFLEKIFLLSEEFQKKNPRSVRMSRHLYDLEKLMDTPYGHDALADNTLYHAIMAHRKTYYNLKYVNYQHHNRETINFMIPKQAQAAWQADYNDLQRYFIYGRSLDFDALLSRMQELQDRVREGV